jgi:hypothetical protein
MQLAQGSGFAELQAPQSSSSGAAAPATGTPTRHQLFALVRLSGRARSPACRADSRPTLRAVDIDPKYGLYRLGTEQGGNLRLWRYALDLQAARVREGRDLEGGPDFDFWRLDADAHFLIVAMRNGLRFAERLQRMLADDGLGTALDDFARRFPHAGNVRDVLTHLDEYVLDEGRLQRKGSVESGSSSWVAKMVGGEVVLGYGPFTLPLLGVAAAASEVMGLAEVVWGQGIRDNRDGVDEADT